MPNVMHRRRPDRLERSCAGASCDRADWIRVAPDAPGLERIEACFAGHGYDPHRHDTYAVGLTLAGVQAFRYGGRSAASLPGQAVVLHPDEVHDGHAGAEGGFRYRLAYIEPRLVQAALGPRRSALPFVREPVSTDARLIAAIAPVLAELDRPLEELERDAAVAGVAEALAALDGSSRRTAAAPACRQAVARARAHLEAHAGRPVASAELEAVTGLGRFELARQFRACLGTSPYRYQVLRRLERARALLLAGTAPAAAAAAAGFSDQSHMIRQFRRAYGLTPGHWLRLVAAGRQPLDSARTPADRGLSKPAGAGPGAISIEVGYEGAGLRWRPR